MAMAQRLAQLLAVLLCASGARCAQLYASCISYPWTEGTRFNLVCVHGMFTQLQCARKCANECACMPEAFCRVVCARSGQAMAPC